MAMTPGEIRAYQRGYSAAKQNWWPETLPPMPAEVVQRLVDSVTTIRDKADALRATFDPDDEVVTVFEGMIDEADAARAAVIDWMRKAIAAPVAAQPSHP